MEQRVLEAVRLAQRVGMLRFGNEPHALDAECA
jgi:hypothetical protein